MTAQEQKAIGDIDKELPIPSIPSIHKPTSIIFQTTHDIEISIQELIMNAIKSKEYDQCIVQLKSEIEKLKSIDFLTEEILEKWIIAIGNHFYRESKKQHGIDEKQEASGEIKKIIDQEVEGKGKDFFEIIIKRIEKEYGDKGSFINSNIPIVQISQEMKHPGYDPYKATYHHLLKEIGVTTILNYFTRLRDLASSGLDDYGNFIFHEYIHSLQEIDDFIKKMPQFSNVIPPLIVLHIFLEIPIPAIITGFLIFFLYKIHTIKSDTIKVNILTEVQAHIADARYADTDDQKFEEILKELLSGENYKLIKNNNDIKTFHSVFLAVKELYSIGFSDKEIALLISENLDKTKMDKLLIQKVTKIKKEQNLSEQDMKKLQQIDDLRRKIFLLISKKVAQEEITEAFKKYYPLKYNHYLMETINQGT